MKHHSVFCFINTVEHKICTKLFLTFTIQHRGPRDLTKHMKIRREKITEEVSASTSKITAWMHIAL